jgi:hypothetical protein
MNENFKRRQSTAGNVHRPLNPKNVILKAKSKFRKIEENKENSVAELGTEIHFGHENFHLV